MKLSRRIDTKASQTAEITCAYRAFSFLEKNPIYKSEDWVAPKLLPRKLKALAKIPFATRIITRLVAPKGMYEWVIARTKYVDSIFASITAQQFDQVLILGAGFDSRAIRFHKQLDQIPVFELDAGSTQILKNRQFRAREIRFPDNLTLVSINFDLESLPEKLLKSGFRENKKTLVLIEGVMQYLKEESVKSLFSDLQAILGKDSLLICDFARKNTLPPESSKPGSSAVMKILAHYGESWQFGLDENEASGFLFRFGFTLIDLQTPEQLEQNYFRNQSGRLAAKIDKTQFILTSQKD